MKFHFAYLQQKKETTTINNDFLRYNKNSKISFHISFYNIYKIQQRTCLKAKWDSIVKTLNQTLTIVCRGNHACRDEKQRER